MTAETQHHASHMANVQSTTECWNISLTCGPILFQIKTQNESLVTMWKQICPEQEELPKMKESWIKIKMIWKISNAGQEVSNEGTRNLRPRANSTTATSEGQIASTFF